MHSATSEIHDVAVGVFSSTDEARGAIQALKDAGFDGGDISLVMPDASQARQPSVETDTHATSGAVTGAVAGGMLGGLGGFLVGLGALAIPGVGPILAAGAIATTLTGAAVGAGVGGLAGSLIGLGIPASDADYYASELGRGDRTLLAVRADARLAEADRILHEHGAYDVAHESGRGQMVGGSGQ